MNRGNSHKKIPFKYHAPEAKAVFLAGSFNGWNVSANPLKKDKEGYWSTTVKLFSGIYEYLFVVDGEWKDDPNCEKHYFNRYGGYNCLLTIEES
jgi:1,4-alpha-glucan branching enzyme